MDNYKQNHEDIKSLVCFTLSKTILESTRRFLVHRAPMERLCSLSEFSFTEEVHWLHSEKYPTRKPTNYKRVIIDLIVQHCDNIFSSSIQWFLELAYQASSHPCKYKKVKVVIYQILYILVQNITPALMNSLNSCLLRVCWPIKQTTLLEWKLTMEQILNWSHNDIGLKFDKSSKCFPQQMCVAQNLPLAVYVHKTILLLLTISIFICFCRASQLEFVKCFQ